MSTNSPRTPVAGSPTRALISTEDTWRPPPHGLRLARRSVHLWRIELRQPAEILAGLATLLDDDERARAGKFRFAADRHSFTVARGALRQILGRYYLELDPRALRFAQGSFGKPFLPGRELRFNLSHSADLAVLAVARRREVGVDVEQIRRLGEDALAIAERFFSATECEKFRAVANSSGAEQAFFTCWTRKEAFIKAIGEGLSHPLDSFDVTFLPEEEVTLRLHGHASGTATGWSLHPLTALCGYAAALVVEGPAPVLACWHWRRQPSA